MFDDDVIPRQPTAPPLLTMIGGHVPLCMDPCADPVHSLERGACEAADDGRVRLGADIEARAFRGERESSGRRQSASCARPGRLRHALRCLKRGSQAPCSNASMLSCRTRGRRSAAPDRLDVQYQARADLRAARVSVRGRKSIEDDIAGRELILPDLRGGGELRSGIEHDCLLLVCGMTRSLHISCRGWSRSSGASQGARTIEPAPARPPAAAPSPCCPAAALDPSAPDRPPAGAAKPKQDLATAGPPTRPRRVLGESVEGDPLSTRAGRAWGKAGRGWRAPLPGLAGRRPKASSAYSAAQRRLGIRKVGLYTFLLRHFAPTSGTISATVATNLGSPRLPHLVPPHPNTGGGRDP